MKERVIQLLARYIGMLLVAIGFAASADAATGIATAIVSIILIVIDLWLHKVREKKATVTAAAKQDAVWQGAIASAIANDNVEHISATDVNE